MIMENDRLMLRRLEDKDLNGLIRLRDDLCVYRYEPAFLIELQGTPAEALKIIQETDLWKDRQCILGIFEKNNPDIILTKDILEASGMAKNEFSVYRERLIKKGIIESKGYGTLSFILPRFSVYVRKQAYIQLYGL